MDLPELAIELLMDGDFVVGTRKVHTGGPFRYPEKGARGVYQEFDYVRKGTDSLQAKPGRVVSPKGWGPNLPGPSPITKWVRR